MLHAGHLGCRYMSAPSWCAQSTRTRTSALWWSMPADVRPSWQLARTPSERCSMCLCMQFLHAIRCARTLTRFLFHDLPGKTNSALQQMSAVPAELNQNACLNGLVICSCQQAQSIWREPDTPHMRCVAPDDLRAHLPAAQAADLGLS